MAFFSSTSEKPIDLSQDETTITEQLEQPEQAQEEITQDQMNGDLEQDALDQPDQAPTVDEGDDEPESSNVEPVAKLREWQSKYDKLQSEYEQFKRNAGLPKEVLDVAEIIQKRPDLLDVIDKYQRGEPVGPRFTADSPEAIQQKLASLKKPVRPERPKDDDYEAQEAYEQAYKTYLDQRMDYIDQREELEQQLQESTSRMQAQQAQLEQQKTQLVAQLKSQHSFTDNDVSQFFELFNAQPDIKDLVTLYRIKTGKLAAPKQGSQRTASPPPAVAGSRAAGRAPSSGFFSTQFKSK